MKTVPFERSFAFHPMSAQWSNKNDVKPENIAICSGKKFWFFCETCNHSFDCALNNINKGHNCPYCHNQRLCEDLTCKFCLSNSFASTEKSKNWNYELNESVPRSVFKNSGKKYWLNCSTCKHAYDTTLCNATFGYSCPYCSNTKLCSNDKCSCCYDRSFASNEKSKYWSSKNNEKPRDVFKNCNSKYLFDCTVCKHEISVSLNTISGMNSFCKFCGHRELCDDKNCQFCFQHSFASSSKINCWDKEKNKEDPRNIFLFAVKKYHFSCDVCKRKFQASIANVSNGYFCPFCVNKTEGKLHDKLILLYTNLKRRYTADWCKNKSHLPFDFVLENIKIIIELDGAQHFRQISNWQSFEETQRTDRYKMECAINNGFSVIRILQEDVWIDKFDWMKELTQTIENIKNKNPQIVYICKNNEYDMYKKSIALNKN